MLSLWCPDVVPKLFLRLSYCYMLFVCCYCYVIALLFGCCWADLCVVIVFLVCSYVVAVCCFLVCSYVEFMLFPWLIVLLLCCYCAIPMCSYVAPMLLLRNSCVVPMWFPC